MTTSPFTTTLFYQKHILIADVQSICSILTFDQFNFKMQDLTVGKRVIYPELLDSEKITQLNNLTSGFCGLVFPDVKTFITHWEKNPDVSALIYICGNIPQILDSFSAMQVPLDLNQVLIVTDFSVGYSTKATNLVRSKSLPKNICHAGVFFEDYFEGTQWFDQITSTHKFQTLTESNKTSSALRTGLYLSNVTLNTDSNFEFNLLRCSTNFQGPTENFNSTDHLIIDKLNHTASCFFDNPAKFNHVLAQVYNNFNAETNPQGIPRSVKAKIKAHSDKTKDMDSNGIMAFCTFYSQPSQPSHVGFSAFYTRLLFKLKPDVKESLLVKEFSITLGPNSVFMMGLETNRLYTHEIRPSHLDPCDLPTRLGYVVRCSKTTGVYNTTDNKVYIKTNESDGLVELRTCTDSDVDQIKSLYFQENTTSNVISYGQIDCSLNQGDYLKPTI
jgi:hypothetical protein